MTISIHITDSGVKFAEQYVSSDSTVGELNKIFGEDAHIGPWKGDDSIIVADWKSLGIDSQIHSAHAASEIEGRFSIGINEVSSKVWKDVLLYNDLIDSSTPEKCFRSLCQAIYSGLDKQYGRLEVESEKSKNKIRIRIRDIDMLYGICDTVAQEQPRISRRIFYAGDRAGRFWRLEEHQYKGSTQLHLYQRSRRVEDKIRLSWFFTTSGCLEGLNIKTGGGSIATGSRLIDYSPCAWINPAFVWQRLSQEYVIIPGTIIVEGILGSNAKYLRKRLMHKIGLWTPIGKTVIFSYADSEGKEAFRIRGVRDFSKFEEAMRRAEQDVGRQDLTRSATETP